MNPNPVIRLGLTMLSLCLVACTSSPEQDAGTSADASMNASDSVKAEPAPPAPPPAPEPYESLPVYLAGTDLGQPVDVIESLRSFACTSGNQETSIFSENARAIEKMQKQAFELNADAVVNVMCTEGGLKNGCWGTRLCEGEAVRILVP